MNENETHAKTCVLNERCKLAAGPQCNRQCSSFIALHGMSGKGGRIGAAGLPDDYRLTTLINSPARAGQPEVYRMLEQYVGTFERQFEAEGGRIKSLYLFSESPGNGKTTSAAALLNEFIMRHYVGSLKRNRQPNQSPALFLDTNEFQTQYNLATMTKDEAGLDAIKAKIKRAQQASFCVMDDIGIRSASEAFKSYMHAIINYRCANGLPTVYTSNLPIDEMANVFDSRLYDRMRDQCAVIHFEGASKRGKRS